MEQIYGKSTLDNDDDDDDDHNNNNNNNNNQLVLHGHRSPHLVKQVCNWVVYCKYLTGIELLDLVAQSVNGWESWK